MRGKLGSTQGGQQENEMMIKVGKVPVVDSLCKLEQQAVSYEYLSCTVTITIFGLNKKGAYKSA